MRAISLPGPITYAVLPYGPHSRQLAEAAHRQGKEIMLHMPMDNDNLKPLGPGGLTVQLSRSAFMERLEQAIRAVPHISGINNHMGSKLTRNPLRMAWLMALLSQHTLYFVDSRTTAASVAAGMARQQRIPNLERDIFLDHDPSPAAIDQQFKQLIKLAKQHGSAVAIGHPYPTTLDYLEQAIPKLNGLGIRLVTPSGLLLLQDSETFPNRGLAAANSAEKIQQPCTITEELARRLVNCG